MNWEKAFGSCFQKIVFCLISVFFVLFCLTPGISAEPRKLKDISLHDTEGGFQIVIVGDGPVEDYHLYYFAEPWRMVLDVPGKWDYPGASVFRLSNDTVKYIVLGEHPEKMRITAHLKGKKVVSPTIEKTPMGLILTVMQRDTVSYNGIPQSEEAAKGRESGKRELKEIRPLTSEEGFKAEIIADGPIESHKRFYISDEDPKKFVLDIPGKWETSVKSAVETEGTIVRRVRLGIHRNFLRLAFDLKTKTAPYPVVMEEEYGLTLILKK